jgi:hypothetical protein
MPERSISIRSLWRGPSEQPPWQRFNGQVRQAKNVRFDIAFGATKRGPTEFVQRLRNGTPPLAPGDPEFLWIAIRDAIVAIGENVIVGWGNDGNELTVVDDTSVTPPFNGYLQQPDTGAFSAMDHLDWDAAEDTVLIANRLVTVATLDSFTPQEALNVIYNGDETDAAPVSASDPGPPDNSQTDFQDLLDQDDDSPYAVGAFVRVKFDSNLDPAGLYIKADPTGGAHPDNFFPQHSDFWYRIPPEPRTDGRYDPTTMPLRIVYDEVAGTLTVSSSPWSQRLSGSPATNLPVVKDRRIVSLRFFQGRLVLFTPRTINASRHRDFFNLWVNAVGSIVDDDRMALDSGFSSLGRIQRSAVLGRAVLMLLERGQVALGSGPDQRFATATAQQQVLADFKPVDRAPGIGPGRTIFADQWEDIHEFVWTGVGIIYRGILNIHDPDLLHNKALDAIFIHRSTTYLVLSEDNMLVHDSYRAGEELLQSAFGEFEMRGRPVFVDEFGGAARIVTVDEDGYTLVNYFHRRPVPPDDMPFMPRMDEQEIAQGVYEPLVDETTFVHSGRDGSDASRVVVRSPGKEGAFLVPKRVQTDGSIVVAGQWDDTGGHYIGFTWETELGLTELYAEATAILVILSEFVVFYHETTDFVITATVPGASTELRAPFQAARHGQHEVGSAVLETGFQPFQISGDARFLDILLTSDTPGQVTWNAFEYLAQIEGRGR